MRQLNERAGTVNASERLSTDPDPKVRSAFVDVLFTDRPRAKKTDMQPGLHGEFRTYTWFQSKQEEAVNRLLRDPDETVRRKSLLQAVCELESADQFKEALTETVRTGSTPERVIVARESGVLERATLVRGDRRSGWSRTMFASPHCGVSTLTATPGSHFRAKN